MVSLINLGNFSNVNGRNVLTGSASGLDVEGLVKGLAEAKRLPAVQLENSITKNNKQISALTDLKASLKKLQDSLNALRNPGGIGNASSNAFSARVPYLTMTGGKTTSEYVGVTTANGAPIGRYELEINKLATAEVRQSITFTDRTSSVVEANGGDTAGKFSAGTFKINGVDVTLTEGSNLNDVAAAINAVSSQTKVSATILKFADNDFRLVMTGKETGLANAMTITDATDSVFPTTPIMTIKQPADDAQIVFNDEVITRSTNKISDLVDNVTFSLYQETNGETITLDVDKDSTNVATSIGSFVDAYNEIRVFVSKQQEKNTDGTLKETAILNNNATMNTVVNRIFAQISEQMSTSLPSYLLNDPTAPNRLGDLGITFSDFAGDVSDPENPIPATSNILNVDAGKLGTMLESFYEDVQKIFEFNFSASSASLSVFKRDNTVTETNLKIDIDETQTDPNLKAKITHIDGQELATPIYLKYEVVGANRVISGLPGTPFEKFSTVSAVANGSVNFTTGAQLTEKAATIDIDTSRPDGEKAKLTHLFGYQLLTAVNMEYTAGTSSSTIKGAAGSPFAGLEMIYTGDGTEAINFSMSQGIADKMFNSLDSVINDLNGQTNMIDAAIENLQKSNDTLQTSIDKIDTQIESYRQQLLEKFSALEAAITAANNVLMLLGAQSDARNNA